MNPNPTILVVEDEELLLDAITKKLELSSINVVSCTSGMQALDYLKAFDTLPNAIWLDYYLRDMNGLEFMQKLKQDPLMSKIPVIVVSNSANPEKVHNMLALGAKQYLLKAEYRLDDIIKTVRKLILENQRGN